MDRAYLRRRPGSPVGARQGVGPSVIRSGSRPPGPLAQLAEQRTFNPRVVRSSRTRPTREAPRSTSRTAGPCASDGNWRTGRRIRRFPTAVCSSRCSRSVEKWTLSFARDHDDRSRDSVGRLHRSRRTGARAGRQAEPRACAVGAQPCAVPGSHSQRPSCRGTTWRSTRDISTAGRRVSVGAQRTRTGAGCVRTRRTAWYPTWCPDCGRPPTIQPRRFCPCGRAPARDNSLTFGRAVNPTSA